MSRLFPFLDDMLGDVPPAQEAGACHADAPGESVVPQLQAILAKKYELMLAYIHYGDQLCAFFRDGVYKHFQEHVAEERAGIYELHKKIIALGGAATLNATDGPLCPAVPVEDAKAAFEALLRMETEVVQLWSALFRQTEHDVPLNALAQEGAALDQSHADDMHRYLRSVC